MFYGTTLTRYHELLLSWYHKYGRKELFWRNLPRDGSESYKIYISEVMLQQTQLTRVLDFFYFPFLKQFPNLESLAKSSQESILKMWQGLGYYSRARNLQQSAMICLEKYHASLPSKPELLRELPGIGNYTAGAISCFGFGQNVAFYDSNIKRVFCRLFSLATSRDSLLQEIADRILCFERSFDYNQALLDLGALVCKPKPLCLQDYTLCPLYSLCEGRERAMEFPQSRKKDYQNLDLCFMICTYYKENTMYIAFTKSKEKLYYGLYNLPQFLCQECDIQEKEKYRYLGEIQHSYTKYRIHAKIWLHVCNDKEECQDFFHSLGENNLSCSALMQNGDIVFFPNNEMNNLPMSTLTQKALAVFAAEYSHSASN